MQPSDRTSFNMDVYDSWLIRIETSQLGSLFREFHLENMSAFYIIGKEYAEILQQHNTGCPIALFMAVISYCAAVSVDVAEFQLDGKASNAFICFHVKLIKAIFMYVPIVLQCHLPAALPDGDRPARLGQLHPLLPDQHAATEGRAHVHLQRRHRGGGQLP